MGASASKISSKGWAPRTAVARIYSFDALGTIYDFKEPVALQYTKVARKCGVTGDFNEHDVAAAFAVAYQQTSKDFPNYGSGKLSTPLAWWDLLVHRTFRQILPEGQLPDGLGYAMYQHFASGSAYKLRTDAVSAFSRKKGFNREAILRPQTKKWWKMVWICCIITNSDPRVEGILRDLGLKVGSVAPARTGDLSTLADFSRDDFDPKNDIDFVCTSYESGSEKPGRAIFDFARRQAVAVSGSYVLRFLEELEQLDPKIKKLSMEEKMRLLPDPTSFPKSKWIHLGNEYEKDSLGAVNAGIIPAHLCTDGQLQEWREKLQEKGGFAVRNLPDVFDYS